MKALQAFLDSEGKVNLGLKELEIKELSQGNVVIKVHYSSVNYKDALAATNAKSGVIREYPIVLGIDLSGEVVESDDPKIKVGDFVIVTSYGLGVSHDGGYSEYARVPAEWVVPLPDGLTLKEAMILGTAGFTAGQSVDALEQNGANPADLPVLVRGATGGLGSMAVKMLSQKGYTVIAESRKKETSSTFLHNLGASNIQTPQETQLEKARPLSSQKWQAIIDPVGGDKLADYLAQVKENGTIALSGNAGGIKFSATVLPFILRGITLKGINSVQVPQEERQKLWQRLATDLKPSDLTSFVDQELQLEELPAAFQKMIDGKMTGRFLVKVFGE